MRASRRFLGLPLLIFAGCVDHVSPGTDASSGDARTDAVFADRTSDSQAADVPRADVTADAVPDVFTPPGCATPQLRPVLTVDQQIGVNGVFVDSAMGYTAFGAVREYHDWGWNEGNGDSAYPGYPNNRDQFSPAYPDPSWDFDAFYSRLHAANVVVVPDVEGSAWGWLTPSISNVPVPSGADPTLPASYAAHAGFMYQLAARYGHTMVPDAMLRLAPGQPRTTGAGTLDYVEDGNEPNAFWVSDPTMFFTAPMYAAMASADYDGDCGRMAPDVGARNADPHVRMAMAGLTSDSTGAIDLAFLNGIKTWADMHRSGSFPADVINVHHYAFGSGAGVSPEQYGFREHIAALVAWRDANVPNRELWLSEFGWDTNPASPLAAHAVGSLSAPTVQGAWIVRAYLAVIAAGIDRAHMFQLVDVDEAGTGQFASAGLIWHGGGLPSGVHDGDPKPGWYFVNTLRTRLTGMRFHGEQASGNPNVMVFTFRDDSTGRGAYVVWCPSSTDAHVNGYSLALQGSPTMATRVDFRAGQTNGTESALTIASNHVSVDAGEVPLFVMVDAMP